MPGVSKKTPLPHWRRVMERAGWLTASDVARAARIPNDTAHRTVYGKTTPSLETILKIAEAANVHPEDIARDVVRYLIEQRTASGAVIR